MSADPNKKSSRNFQCRDVLWETFEQMARELECSVDYLINEAMKQYARQRSYGAGASRTPFPGMRGAGEAAQQASGHSPSFPSQGPAGPSCPLRVLLTAAALLRRRRAVEVDTQDTSRTGRRPMAGSGGVRARRTFLR